MTVLCANALVMHEAKVLLLRRSDRARDDHGLWDFPGGELAAGESPEEAARREAAEEAGLDVHLTEQLAVYEWPGAGGRRVRVTTFLAEPAGEPAVRLSEEHDEHAWVAPRGWVAYPLVWHVRATMAGLEGAPPDTPALAALSSADLGFEVVRTPRARSVEESAALQGIEVGRLIRTIVVRRGAGDYLFVLVPGDRAIDWPKLRAHLGVSRLSLPSADEAREATGYERGAITPFGSAVEWPVVADATVPARARVAIGGGGHGINLHLDSAGLIAHLGADVADVTKPA